MMTEATSDESDADSDSSIGPVALRREETMVCGQAGAVPSYKDEETRTDTAARRLREVSPKVHQSPDRTKVHQSAPNKKRSSSGWL